MWSNFKHTVLIAMSLFKPDAEETLQKTLDAAKSIAGRLVTAKTLLAERHATAIELARDNADDATHDEAKGKLRAAQIRVDTLSAALTETDQKILQLEQELVAVADKKQREAAAFEIEKTAEGFASAAADTVTSLSALALHTEAMARFLPDAAFWPDTTKRRCPSRKHQHRRCKRSPSRPGALSQSATWRSMEFIVSQARRSLSITRHSLSIK